MLPSIIEGGFKGRHSTNTDSTEGFPSKVLRPPLIKPRALTTNYADT